MANEGFQFGILLTHFVEFPMGYVADIRAYTHTLWVKADVIALMITQQVGLGNGLVLRVYMQYLCCVQPV